MGRPIRCEHSSRPRFPHAITGLAFWLDAPLPRASEKRDYFLTGWFSSIGQTGRVASFSLLHQCCSSDCSTFFMFLVDCYKFARILCFFNNKKSSHCFVVMSCFFFFTLSVLFIFKRLIINPSFEKIMLSAFFLFVFSLLSLSVSLFVFLTTATCMLSKISPASRAGVKRISQITVERERSSRQPPV